MAVQAFFHSFQPLSFGYTVKQRDAIRVAMKATRECHTGSEESLHSALSLYEQFMATDAIETRVTCVGDSNNPESEWRLFNRKESDWAHPPLEKRMELYREVALQLARQAFERDTDAPDYLVQVSCTGYDSPHASQKLVASKNWGTKSHLLHVGHMGCYAALPVSAMTANLLHGKRALTGSPSRASLLFIELCSIHLDPTRTDAQQIVMNTLFADGGIRFDVSPEKTGEGFSLLSYSEELLPDTADEMTWILKDSSFGMTLGRAVPVLLKRNSPAFIEQLLEPTGLGIKDIHAFAIHPGGPRIVDYVGDALHLIPEQTRHSREVLRARGNMSSCTVPHIWERILKDPSIPSGAHVVSMAFGPGLTIAGNILRKEI